MKPLLLAFLLVGTALLSGCAGDGEPLVEEAGEDLQRGLTGGGTLYQQSQANDPFINDSGR